MEPQALVNKKIIRHSPGLRLSQKRAKAGTGKGERSLLKNYLGKAVSLSSEALVGREPGISGKTDSLTQEALLRGLREAGLTGMSGNGFPVARKIEQFLRSGAARRVLVINAVECDPGLLHDDWLLKNRFPALLRAIGYLRQALSLQSVLLAAKEKRVAAHPAFTLKTVPARYPMGEEHFLIRQVLNIRLPANRPPAMDGILVLNVQSVYQIGKIVNQCYDKGRFITMADLHSGEARVAYVHAEDTVQDILRSGLGPGEGMFKGTGILSCSRAGEQDDFSFAGNFAAYAPPPPISDGHKCRNCGTCSRRCPMGIPVSKIVRAMDSGRMQATVSAWAQPCIHCGSCTYFCPASKNVAGYVSRAFGEKGERA